MEKMIFSSTVPSEFNGVLLTHYLSRRFTYLPESEWRRQLARGRIGRNGHSCWDDLPIQTGDSISFAPDMSEFPEPSADLNIQIVYEDKWIIGVNKPGNLLVHHQGRSLTHNLIYQLRYRFQPLCPSACLVHRLDRETSGVLMVARHGDYVVKLNELFNRHQVEKTYLAVVHGRPKLESGSIDAPIGRDPDSVVSYRYTADARAVNAKKASTRYQVIATRGNSALVRLVPASGRTHQLRVHLAHIGHPIVGDKLYGRSDVEFIQWRDRSRPEHGDLLGRQSLHAESLHFIHPWTGEEIRLHAAMPEDMGGWFDSAD